MSQLEATICRQDKPQGFEVGKKAKQGDHVCFWNCGRVFRSQNDAKCHQPCIGRDESDRTIKWMYNQRGLPVHYFNNLKKDKERSNMVLQQLPQLNREDFVDKWIVSSPFPTTWVPNSRNQL